jgi:plasmid stabilization system protein ParE
VIVVWRPIALRDVAAVTAHIAAENPIAAKRVARELVVAGDSLASFPGRGRLGRARGTRELVALRPDIIVYQVAPTGEPTILRVWHAAQHRP